MGTGCARGFLAAFDLAWMVKSWAQGRPVLEVLAERYKQTSAQYVPFYIQVLYVEFLLIVFIYPYLFLKGKHLQITSSDNTRKHCQKL